jgi:hypothetical protein
LSVAEIGWESSVLHIKPSPPDLPH